MENRRKINTTLALILNKNKVLLGQKKRGFAQGTFNGIGGKQDPGETIEETMIRETQEEIGVTPTGSKLVGNIDFENINYKGECVDINLSIFACDGYKGTIQETEEMIPQWFDKNKLPLDQMLPDDKLWFPLVFDGDFIKGKIVYDDEMNRINYSFNKQQNEIQKI